MTQIYVPEKISASTKMEADTSKFRNGYITYVNPRKGLVSKEAKDNFYVEADLAIIRGMENEDFMVKLSKSFVKNNVKGLKLLTETVPLTFVY